ncbi:MAG TPA: hypothetical protein VMT91_15415, partial [Anaerolineales bacterium]|nr:hypothetical protein [Anaerolineales bacterium]
TLVQSATGSTPWTSVDGSLAGGYSLSLDGVSSDFDYINVDTLTANTILKDGYQPFTLDTTSLPSDFYSYWAGRGVDANAGSTYGATSWQAYMWQIIQGSQPMFYLKVSGSTYMLVDGLGYLMGSPDGYLRISGDYPAGSYTFDGVLTNLAGGTKTMTAALTVQKYTQATLSVTGPASLAYGATGVTTQITTTGGSGLGTITYAAVSPDTTGCTVDTNSGEITVTDPTGVCKVTATKASDLNYNAATSAAFTVTLTQAGTTTSVACTSTSLLFGNSTTCTATVAHATGSADPSGTVSWNLSGAGDTGTFTTSPCTLSTTGGVTSCSVTYLPTAVGNGAPTIGVTYSGDGKYLGSSGDTGSTITVGKGNTTTTVSCVSPMTVGSASTCTATVTPASGSVTPTGTVSWSVTGDTGTFTPISTCTLSGTGGTASCQIYYTPASTTTPLVQANYGGDANYNGGSGDTSGNPITVNKADQSLSFTSTPPTNVIPGVTTYTPTATTTASGLSVTITVDASASAVCSINAGLVSFIGGGKCVLDANQPGNANYNPASQIQQTFDVEYQIFLPLIVK